MRKKRAGIIGCGHIAGWNELDPGREKPCTHLGAYNTREDVEVVGCCDSDIRRAKRFAHQFKIDFFTDSIEALLDRKMDVLSVCVPYKHHFEIFRLISDRKNGPQKIFMEKPISDDFDKAKKMVDISQRTKIKLYVNNRRLSPVYQALRRIIKEDFDNQIISIVAWCSSGMHAVGIHVVDLLRSICGEAVWVYATQEKEKIVKLPYSHNFTPDDPRFSVCIGFKKGVKAHLINTARTDFSFFEIEVLCRKGRIRVADNGEKIVYQTKIKPGQSTLSYRLGQEKFVKFKQEALFKKVINEILDGDYSKSPLHAKQALLSYQIIEAMKKSATVNQVQYLRELIINEA